MKQLRLLIFLMLSFSWQLNGAEPKALKWQKYDQHGEQVPIKEGPWSCALDKETGLLWEVKSWHEAEHYYKATYTYYDESNRIGVKNGGSCQQGSEWFACDVTQLINFANQQKYCGVNTWRLPTINELKTLIYTKEITGKLQINPYIFPRTTRGVYMSSDIKHLNDQWYVDMFNFFTLAITSRPMKVVANVRLVSGQTIKNKG